MVWVPHPTGSGAVECHWGMAADLSEIFRAEYVRLVQALAVAHGDTEVAAEAVQDAFVQATRHWHRVAGYDDPAGWIRTVAVRRLLDRRRGLRRREAAFARLDPSPAHTDAVPDVDLARAIAALPAGQRMVVCLHHLADLPVDAVAGAMGIAAGTVKSQLSDARRALARSLEVADG
jgi:RNA polymerase sigma-70 factor, ECF subfamily